MATRGTIGASQASKDTGRTTQVTGDGYLGSSCFQRPLRAFSRYPTHSCPKSR